MQLLYVALSRVMYLWLTVKVTVVRDVEIHTDGNISTCRVRTDPGKVGKIFRKFSRP